MSHITEIKVNIQNLEALKKACDAIGLQFVENKTQHKYFAGSMAKCDHVIRLKDNPNAYEIGVIKNSDGTYKLNWDVFSGGKGMVDAVGGKNAEKLLQHYSVEQAAMALARKGFRVNRKTLQNGSIVLETR